MASISRDKRQEPVLEEDRMAGRPPLVLTKLVREGLPPPLWRNPNDAPSPVFHLESATVAQPPLETPSEPVLTAAEPEAEPAQGDGRRETAAALAPADADETAERTVEQDTPPPPESHQARSLTPEPEAEKPAAPDTPPASLAPAYKTGAIDYMVFRHRAAEPPAPSETVAPAAPDIPQTPEALPIPDEGPVGMDDLEFLREFETHLFAEIERWVTAELESQITQHLQGVWKEQVSQAIMRTLATEGVKLRQQVADHLREQVPEILHRVLREGLNQAVIGAQSSHNP